MTRRRSTEPRAHWVLFTIWLTALFAAFVVDGYADAVGPSGVRAGATPAGASSLATPPGPGEADPVPGPFWRLKDDRWITRSAPPRTVALTFEDGPDPRWTPAVLDALAAAEVKATFFVVGSRVNRYPGLVRRIVAEGHELGVQGFTHTELTSMPRWRRDLEVSLAQNAVIAATGHPTSLFRPPYASTARTLSATDRAVLREVAGDGYLICLADIDAGDWHRPGVPAVLAAAVPRAGQGAVIRLHDGGGDRTQTLTALPALVDRLTDRGYRLVTVSRASRSVRSTATPTRAVLLRAEAARWAQITAAGVGRAMTWMLLLGMVIFLVRMVVQIPLAIIHTRRRQGTPGHEVTEPVTVIVPAYNESANIAATVHSLLDTDYPDVRVIVVDDGSSDDTATIVERLALPQVRVVRQANAGKPAALNHGLALCTTDLVVLVDGDTVFQPDTIALLVQPFARRRVGAVSGNTKVANRHRLLGRWQHLEYVIGFNLDRRMFDIARCIATVPGAIGAFRLAALRQVGGISQDTLAEDTDVTMALLRGGWDVVYEGRALAWTEVPSTLSQLWRQRYRWCYGTLQCVWKHRRAVIEIGNGGRLGRIALSYLLLFQVILPVTAPIADAYALCGLLFHQWRPIAVLWIGMLAVQLALAALALRLDGEHPGPLWTVPLQQLLYRQFLYLVVIQSVVTALVGSRLRWHRMIRTGAATAVLTDRSAAAASH